ncbi:uncharacterized protein EV420DRAFT_1137577 [Desarmillaria tabescens]|uniref:Uncharacterized protein n=1 Tax=Armillaria tabescens TaxID=1929756 RepID=A0AA39MN50_ARMTA|nr:uncharacterized protein EV420DRAFT_1137577 [Desarmillaria tabescens]KAK0440028.1 hypothetical protein EV420DRAFT_1137577 [Desarmillaria tabescens]
MRFSTLQRYQRVQRKPARMAEIVTIRCNSPGRDVLDSDLLLVLAHDRSIQRLRYTQTWRRLHGVNSVQVVKNWAEKLEVLIRDFLPLIGSARWACSEHVIGPQRRSLACIFQRSYTNIHGCRPHLPRLDAGNVTTHRLLKGFLRLCPTSYIFDAE